MSNNLDQFFTDPSVAKVCAEYFKSKTGFKGSIVEPSAGAGAFVDAFEKYEYSGIGRVMVNITPAAIGYVLRGYLENGRKLPDLD